MNQIPNVEKGVAIPVIERGQKKWPWPEMAPGDSFFVPGCEPSEAERIRSNGNSWAFRGLFPLRILARRIDGGYRFWLLRRENIQPHPSLRR